MSMFADLIAKRDAGHVRVSFTTHYDQPLPEVLARFGLGCKELRDPRLREVERSEARTILISLLRQDMAYHADLMPQQEAETLAEQHLDRGRGLMPNNRFEYARLARPARKGDAPLLAADACRWAA